MKIEVRADGSAVIEGYVNAVCRDSRPVPTPRGMVVECIEKRTFERALKRRKDIPLMYNHRKKIASTKDGTVQLKEDTIGLYATCVVSDPDVVAEARAGKLKGWSFGMHVLKDELEERTDKIPRRHILEMDLKEVTLAGGNAVPFYEGTSVEVRSEESDEEAVFEHRAWMDAPDAADITVATPKETIDYSEYEERLKKLQKSGGEK